MYLGDVQGLQQGECPAAAGADVQVSWDVVGGTFIVRFKQYKMASEHRRSLEEGMGGFGLQWRWLERNNSATQHPTDFGLLNINDTDIDPAKVCNSCCRCSFRKLTEIYIELISIANSLCCHQRCCRMSAR